MNNKDDKDKKIATVLSQSINDNWKMSALLLQLLC